MLHPLVFSVPVIDGLCNIGCTGLARPSSRPTSYRVPVFSGFAMVDLLLIMRKGMKLGNYIHVKHVST